MNHSQNGSDTDDGSYETSYFYFLKALTALTYDPAEQCRIMRYDNVAWFLKDDLLVRANVLLNLSEFAFSNDQLRELGIVLSLVGSVPCQVTYARCETRLEHEASMNDPCWTPIRERSRVLIDLLKDETIRVQARLAGEDERD